MAVLQDREETEDPVDLGGLAVGLVVRADLKVLEHGHLRKDPASLGDMADAELDGLVGGEVGDVDAVETDTTQRCVVQARDHPQRGRLTGPVGT